MLHIASRSSEAHCMAMWERRRRSSGSCPKYSASSSSDSPAVMPAFDAAPARSNIAVLKPAYSKSISQSFLPSSRKFAGSRSLWPKTIGSGCCSRLQRVVQRQKLRQPVSHAAAAGLERARIVAVDVEHPEHEAGARHMLRHLARGTRGRVLRSARGFRARPLAQKSSRRERPRPSRRARRTALPARNRRRSPPARP